MHVRDCNSVHTCTYTDYTTSKTRQDTRLIAQLSSRKLTMLASSVQAVVACNCNETVESLYFVVFHFILFTGLLHINLHIHDCMVILSLYAAVYMYTGHVFVGYVHFTLVCVPPDVQPSRLISGQSGCPAPWAGCATG